MKRVLVLTASLVFVASTARAQYLPSGIPTYGGLSALPYVNLLQPNVNPAVTYMGIVQPQLQAQATFQQLQSQINLTHSMPDTVAPPRNAGVSDTGYAPARFMQYQQYFNTVYSTPRGNNRNQSGSSAAVFGQR
jgi:hypothetical protein